ncbi:hypothetical protein HYDPIDRAFT_29968 [Hydnomerulius pinastri MD-312]|uniref:3-carboxymuconate cyclase n=1 Tax=Hydnomerulius pinastri MD-312 TaxID=994086 RepID=A0A0C9W6Z4_9AGAM|nr:hypothetical protein HYDPIDRAFT_29968 [Hydnomerulius pinastri MD-312]
MRLLASSVVAAVLFGLASATAPIRSHSPAAAYFITNEVSGNYVVAGSISNTGSLTLSTATSTGGKGSHNNGTGPDPFFSQGAVATSQLTSYLATVNAGSNTVSLFFINPLDPTHLEMIGSPVSSGGEYPIAVAFSPLGDNLCVLNGGAKNGVQCYQACFSGLIPIANSKRSLGLAQTTPPNGPPGTASTLVFTDDGKYLIAATKGMPGFLAVWDVESDGSLSSSFTKVAVPSGGGLPFSLNQIPGTKAFVASDPASGYDVIDIADSTKSASYAIEGQAASCWSARSQKTGNYYVVDAGTATLNEVHVDSNLKASLVKQYAYANGTTPLDADVASLNNTDYLYQLMVGTMQVGVVSLPAAGQGKVIQTVDISAFASNNSITVSSDHLAGMATYISLF